MMNFINDRMMMLHLGKRSAHARVLGSDAYPKLSGDVDFFAAANGTVVVSRINGLPFDKALCAPNICAMHIHAGGSCTGTEPFSEAMGHYNPGNCPHPAHAGDLPPLFSNHGFAWQAFYTERFKPEEMIGRAVIIHAQRDDFTSQPAGDAGARIGCGVIVKG